MKRKRAKDLGHHPSKRQLTSQEQLQGGDVQDDDAQDDYDDGDEVLSLADGPSSAASYVYSGADSDPESEAESTPATTMTQHGGGVVKTDDGASTTTKSRRIFPSMLKTLRCSHPGCEKTFNRPVRLSAHLRAHAGDRALKCPHEGCDKAYIHDKDLKQHMRGSHSAAAADGSNPARRYACDFAGCDKAFLTATRLRRHAAVHTDEGRFPCRDYEGCDRVFRKRQTLQRHVRADHLGLPAFGCSHDGCKHSGFDTANALKRHVEREHGELRFWCEECGGSGGRAVGFTTMARLMHHMRHAHIDCMFCDARCGGQWQLERHIEMHHSGATSTDRKVVACEWEGCEKKFTRKSNLKAHVKTAHEGFRFVCGEVDVSSTPDLAPWWEAAQRADGDDSSHQPPPCRADFVSKQRLEDHIRVAHLRLEPAKTVRVDDEGGARPAGFFNMYASSTAYTAPELQAQQQRKPLAPCPETELASALPPAVSESVLPVRPAVSLPCGHPGCAQSFPSADELETHVSIFHLMQQQLYGIPDPVPPPIGTASGESWDAAAPSTNTNLFSPYPEPPPYDITMHGDSQSVDQTQGKGSSVSDVICSQGTDRAFAQAYPPLSGGLDVHALVDPCLFLT